MSVHRQSEPSGLNLANACHMPAQIHPASWRSKKVWKQMSGIARQAGKPLSDKII